MSEILSDYTGKIDPEVVTVNNIELPLGEFTMQVRALWMDIAEQYELPKLQNELQTKVIPEISMLSHEIDTDPRIMSAQKRLERLQKKHDALMDVYGEEEEPEDIDDQIDSIVQRMSSVADEIREITEGVRNEMMEKASWADTRVSELMKIQDEARIKFVWTLAKEKEKTDEDFESFFASCGTDDYEAAERLLSEGNAPWASLYTGRMQEKPKKKSLN